MFKEDELPEKNTSVKKFMNKHKGKVSNKNFDNFALKNHKHKKKILKDTDVDEEYEEYNRYVYK